MDLISQTFRVYTRSSVLGRTHQQQLLSGLPIRRSLSTQITATQIHGTKSKVESASPIYEDCKLHQTKALFSSWNGGFYGSSNITVTAGEWLRLDHDQLKTHFSLEVSTTAYGSWLEGNCQHANGSEWGMPWRCVPAPPYRKLSYDKENTVDCVNFISIYRILVIVFEMYVFPHTFHQVITQFENPKRVCSQVTCRAP